MSMGYVIIHHNESSFEGQVTLGIIALVSDLLKCGLEGHFRL